ncbi:hypothetical protein AAFN86_20860 [Roseomonas sp. CAU 1739]|uniref:hypothetical protein n=1 Tax=Roseomonas sp. CAU 1739 TaxID=3140364 RepID=UPI00325AC203
MERWREAPGISAGLVGFVFVGTLGMTEGSVRTAATVTGLYLAVACAVFVVALAALVVLERRSIWEKRLREGQDANPCHVDYPDCARAAFSIALQLPFGAACIGLLGAVLISVIAGGFVSWPDCGPGIPGRLC